MNASRARVVVTHWVHPEVSRYLAEFCDAVMPSREQGVWPRQTVEELAADADGLMACMADRVDEAFLAGCPRLRVIGAALKGYDSFDAGACARHGVWLSTLRGATVGLAGMGQLGQAIARGLAGLGPVIVYYDERRLDAGTEQALAASYLSLERMAEASDVMVAALPLTAATRHLIDAALLRRLRPGAFLVNVGRGSVVDEEAVASALEGGRLGGYAADVFAMEDWALPGRPSSVPDRLLRHPRTLLTPHLGSAVDEIRRQMSLQAARQIRQALAGQQPDHAVNAPG
jgi:phosphonate dehydrogenase